MDERKEQPVFVKLDEYKDLTEIVSLAREKLQQAKRVLNNIQDLKAKEDAAFEAWENELADMETKINDIDKRLMEPEV